MTKQEWVVCILFWFAAAIVTLLIFCGCAGDPYLYGGSSNVHSATAGIPASIYEPPQNNTHYFFGPNGRTDIFVGNDYGSGGVLYGPNGSTTLVY